MKYLCINDIPLNEYQIIGFDLDGTLYDEKEFIKQVYSRIATYFQTVSNINKNEVYIWMLNRWIEKGSSYPYIFSECIEKFNLENTSIEQCLAYYRNTDFRLALDFKIKKLLEKLKMEKQLFLVTDGFANLQKRKFQSLGLVEYFQTKNIVFTGELGRNYYKPDVTALKFIDCLKEYGQKNIIYFGDRHIDEQFAKNAGFDFVHIINFHDFWGERV